MDSVEKSPLESRAEPKTPHCRGSPVSRIESLPRTPSKPKIKQTKLALGDETADFAIICEGTRYTAHKAILSASSPYFARMFRFSGSETSNKEVDVPDVDALSMKQVLDYMYTGMYALPYGITIPATDYCKHSSLALLEGPVSSPKIFKRKCPCAGKCLAPAHLLMHVRIYTVADYLDMFDLKSYAQQGVEDVLHVYWQDESLELADALEEAFTATPDDDRGMRDVMVTALKEHPGLAVDVGDVRAWLDANPDVDESVNWG
ncbi:hypothetical protein COCVIDRAFT_24074 [Bipolaris victoriae FI3]|uniref:BTB domain-containing protein n=1 Tax=Bipolaris victoriae (strain FI3) TaxID=930091 RepID=W7EHB2_BIPV3|nr:hypothetical protein COCVIDRAFT_24074 [Bipolaris victoriae FI3]